MKITLFQLCNYNKLDPVYNPITSPSQSYFHLHQNVVRTVELREMTSEDHQTISIEIYNAWDHKASDTDNTEGSDFRFYFQSILVIVLTVAVGAGVVLIIFFSSSGT